MPTKTRIKSTRHSIDSRDECAAAVAHITTLSIQRNTIANQLDTEIEAARAKHTPRLETLKAEIKLKAAEIERWAADHPTEFGKLKSIVFPSGRIGWRTGTHKLKTLAKATWKGVLEMIESGKMPRFIAVKKAVDKERIIEEWKQGKLTSEQMTTLGIKCIQDESFFIEPDLDSETANREEA